MRARHLKAGSQLRPVALKLDGIEAFTEDTKLYAYWLASHDLEEIMATAPTTDADGKIVKYWHCKKCDSIL